MHTCTRTHACTYVHTHTHSYTYYTYTHTRMHTHMRTRKHARTHTYTYTRTYTCTRTHARTHAHTHTHTYIYAHTHTHIHTHTYTCIHTNTPTRIHAHTHIHIHTHTHVHTHTHTPTDAHTFQPISSAVPKDTVAIEFVQDNNSLVLCFTISLSLCRLLSYGGHQCLKEFALLISSFHSDSTMQQWVCQSQCPGLRQSLWTEISVSAFWDTFGSFQSEFRWILRSFSEEPPVWVSWAFLLDSSASCNYPRSWELRTQKFKSHLVRT